MFVSCYSHGDSPHQLRTPWLGEPGRCSYDQSMVDRAECWDTVPVLVDCGSLQLIAALVPEPVDLQHHGVVQDLQNMVRAAIYDILYQFV